MANPSLQIGNDNWAIKEDNLLGYSTAGTRFVPQPITMTRASAGTRVNSSGLVETVELLGSELITNGDFANWTGDNPDNFLVLNENAANYVTESSNQLRMVSDNSAIIAIRPQPTSMLTVGKIYKVSVDLTFTTGSIDISGTSFNSSGTKVFYINATATYLQIAKTSALDVLIDNLSVKESTKNNLARVDYDGTASSLLVEPERTNEVTYSEDFSRAVGLIALSIGLNQGTSPSGLTDANLLSVGIDESATRHRLYNLYSFVSGDTYTYSLFARKNEQDWFQLMFSASAFDTQSYANFDLNNGSVGNTGTSTTANIIDYGNGWYKCSITCTATASTSTTFEILTTNNTDSGRYPSYQSATAVNVCYLWGAQLEEGSYATSYIPTDGGTVTRVQDQYSKTGISDKIGQTEGTFFIELSKPVLEPDTYCLISLNNAASNSHDNSVTIGFDNDSDDFYIRLRANESSPFTDNDRASLANTFYKIAIAYKSGQSLIYIDGSPITPNSGSLSTDFTFSATLDNLSFDYNGNNGLPFYGNVRQLQVFKTALTGSELAALTS
jgi:hypothetical protein